MEVNKQNKKIARKIIATCLLMLSSSIACNAVMAQSSYGPKTYLGVFGGASAMSGNNLSQFGTVYFLEAFGGPLAVNAFGSSQSKITGILGGHIGIAWPTNRYKCAALTPAMEIEGYYISRVTIGGDLINSSTLRLQENDFLVNYPLSSGVFLANIILSPNTLQCGRWKPYIGVGIGSALLSVSNANALQVNISEGSINHYGADTDDRTIAVAAQTKVGIDFELNCNASIFAEYRFLYLSQTNYSFGSTIDPTHASTSPWLVKMNPQYYNMGIIGIQFTF